MNNSEERRLKKYTIEEVKMFAMEKGGSCLSNDYKNAHSKLKWKCEKGHIWEQKLSIMKSKGYWCPKCGIESRASKKRLSISVVQEAAKNNGGECLSTKYVNNKSPLKFKCKNGHIWKTSYCSVRDGKWCPKCAGKKKYTIEEIKEIAISKKGKCLSNIYKNGQEKLTWECEYGHQWNATSNSIIQGKWCPRCKNNINEEIVRYIFEQLFGKEFNKDRKQLNGSELDGFNKELNLAFEYNGEQHYEDLKFFKKKLSFKERQKNDLKKISLCDEKGIDLIIVPYWISGNDKNVLYIKAELKKLDIQIVNESIIFDNFDVNYKSRERLLKYLDERKGTLLNLSFEIRGNINKPFARVRCEHNHVWLADVYNLLHVSSWCPDCAPNKKKTIEDMKYYAELKNGECLSTEYKGSHIKLKWKCEEGHVFEQRPSTVVQGGWCRQCSQIANSKKAAIKRKNKKRFNDV